MSGRQVYKIVKKAASPAKLNTNRSLDRPQNVFSPPKGRVDNKRLLPIIFTAVVWSVCLPVAYYVWKNKKPEEQVAEVAPEPEEVEKPKRSFYKLNLTSEEKGMKYFEGNVPTVKGLFITVNEEKERVEILNSRSSTWLVRCIPFRNIQRGEDGNLMFDKDGYPVQKPFTIRNFMSDLNAYLKQRDI